MTKEEYLRMYKEDKLAELCERFEKDMNCYHDKLMSCQNDAYIARKKADELSSYWENEDKLFEKLKSIPAKDFIKLYYKMKELIENNTVDKNSNNWRVATINKGYDSIP